MDKDDVDYKKALENLYILFHKLHPPIMDSKEKASTEKKSKAK